jgi:hypothetical protein
VEFGSFRLNSYLIVHARLIPSFANRGLQRSSRLRASPVRVPRHSVGWLRALSVGMPLLSSSVGALWSRGRQPKWSGAQRAHTTRPECLRRSPRPHANLCIYIYIHKYIHTYSSISSLIHDSQLFAYCDLQFPFADVIILFYTLKQYVVEVWLYL